MKIVIENNIEIQIDREDLEKVQAHKWHIYDRYVDATIDGRTIKLHRFLVNALPSEQVDHKNRDYKDNRKRNLRKCTRNQNQANRKVNVNNQVGHKGVQLMANGRYRVRVQKDNQRFHFGCFVTLKEAINARKEFAQQLHGEFYRQS